MEDPKSPKQPTCIGGPACGATVYLFGHANYLVPDPHRKKMHLYRQDPNWNGNYVYVKSLPVTTDGTSAAPSTLKPLGE
jgi:hypothetical protein